MAKAKKKTTKKKTGKRMGAVAMKAETSNALMMIGGAIAGVLVKRLGENALNAQTAVTINPKVLFAGETLLGGIMTVMGKHPFVKGAGLGIAGSSAVQLAQSMKVLNGIGLVDPGYVTFTNNARPMITRAPMSGASITPSVAGVNAYRYPQPSSVGRYPQTLKESQKYAGAGL